MDYERATSTVDDSVAECDSPDKANHNSRFDAVAVKSQFPIFHDNELSKNLCYLDNAATSQKPESVIKAMEDAMRVYHSPVNRGFYPLAETTTDHYEDSRERLRQFIGASSIKFCCFYWLSDRQH